MFIKYLSGHIHTPPYMIPLAVSTHWVQLLSNTQTKHDNSHPKKYKINNH